jgi:hypothetical protein
LGSLLALDPATFKISISRCLIHRMISVEALNTPQALKQDRQFFFQTLEYPLLALPKKT